MGAISIAQFGLLVTSSSEADPDTPQKNLEQKINFGDSMWKLVSKNKAKLGIPSKTSTAKLIGKAEDWKGPGKFDPADLNFETDHIKFERGKITLSRLVDGITEQYTRDLKDFTKSDLAAKPQEAKFPMPPAATKKDEFTASKLKATEVKLQKEKTEQWVKKYAQVYNPPEGVKSKGTIIIDPGHGNYMNDLTDQTDDHYDSGAAYYYKRNAQGQITETKHDKAVDDKAAPKYSGRADEADINLLIANDTAQELAKQGYQVIVTRKDRNFAGYKDGTAKHPKTKKKIDDRLGTPTPDREGILNDLIDVYKPVAILDQQGNGDPDPKTTGHRGFCRRTHSSSKQACQAIQLELFNNGLTKHEYDKRARNENETQYDTIRVARLAFDANIAGVMTENGFISSPSDLQVLLEDRDLANAPDRRDIGRAIATGLIRGLE